MIQIIFNVIMHIALAALAAVAVLNAWGKPATKYRWHLLASIAVILGIHFAGSWMILVFG